MGEAMRTQGDRARTRLRILRLRLALKMDATAWGLVTAIPLIEDRRIESFGNRGDEIAIRFCPQYVLDADERRLLEQLGHEIQHQFVKLQHWATA